MTDEETEELMRFRERLRTDKTSTPDYSREARRKRRDGKRGVKGEWACPQGLEEANPKCLTLSCKWTSKTSHMYDCPLLIKKLVEVRRL